MTKFDQLKRLAATGCAATALYLGTVLPSLAQDAAAAAPTPKLDTGDTAWMLTSTVLVILMTVPGLALFYAGMVRKKNVLSVLTATFATFSLLSLSWFAVGYTLAFTDGGPYQPYIGGLSKALFAGITPASLQGTIPELVFALFQLTFAAITPALIIGAVVDRMKFSALLIFMLVWQLVVYVPVAHWVWGGGFLGSDGVLDFAGGTVVHINAGIAGLVACLVLGRRKGFGTESLAPYNLTLTLIGASLLWVGWFGFNVGSALAAGSSAAVAMTTTQLATAAAAIGWMLSEWLVHGKPTLLGLASGAVAGLVAITPACGFVDPKGAIVIGIAAAVICYISSTGVKKALGYDDSLDVFGVHGIGGIVGAILTGVFAVEAYGGKKGLIDGNFAQVPIQLYGILATVVWSAVATLVILIVLKYTIGIRVSESAEIEGLDIALHGESLQ
jgi:Amt family ammonium transporter